MAYNPANVYNPSTEWRIKKNTDGTYNAYFLEPTNIQSDTAGSYAKGGNITKSLTNLTYNQLREQGIDPNTTYSMIGTPEEYTANARYSAEDIKKGVIQAFQEFDPNNQTGWGEKINDLTTQAQTLYSQDPTRQDKIFGDVWNTFRYKPEQAQSIQTIQEQNAAAQNEADKAETTPTGNVGTTPTIQIETSKGMFIPFQGTEQEAKDYVAKGGALSYRSNVGQTESNVANVQKLYETLGLSTMGLGSQFTGTPAQVEAIKNATGGQFNITPEALTQAQTISVPEVTTTPYTSGTFANAMVAGANTSLQNLIAQLTPAETDADRQQQNLLNQMTSLVGQNAQKAADQLTQEQAAGLPALRQQFADINAQILSKTAEYNALQTENQNKPITMNSIIGNERAILNAKAADIGLLQARALGLQGQIQTAQDTVNRAIDLKYSTIQAQLEVYKAQLNALQPTLNKQEKIQAQAQQLLIDQYQQQLQDAKTEEQNIQKAMLSYIEAGGKDLNVMNQISSAPNATTAYQIMGQNAPIAPDKTEIREIGNRTLLINSVTGETIKDLGYSGPTTTKQTEEEKQIEAFKKEAGDLVTKLVTKEYTWGQAYDILKTKYPQATPDTINATLGGGIPYDQTTGKFDTKKAWGLAK